MNHWLSLSLEYANSRNYLDSLYKIYPTIPNNIRDVDEAKWSQIEKYYTDNNKYATINALLDLDLFPIKDSYVAYLKKDRTALARNPKTVDRIFSILKEIGLDKMYENCSTPKEANRQIGPMFKNWLRSGTLGFSVLRLSDFENTSADAILDASDTEMMMWCKDNLGYQRNKGLDFVARINSKFVIGEAKFLTDFGGHQSNQLEDAIRTLTTKHVSAICIAILDGVCYIRSSNKMCKLVQRECANRNIMSALLLREFLYTL